MTHRVVPWSIVLAAGEGRRLQSMTKDAEGVSTPKQFCSLYGGPTLLRDALGRAFAVSPPERTCAIVAAQHERWWRPELADLAAHNVFVQPQNRGTGNGILLPLLHIAERDPNAAIVLLPSDHHVQDEWILADALRTAVRLAQGADDGIVLLGISPDEADAELGYIVPEDHAGQSGHGLRAVSRFIEKPASSLAENLVRCGALWNSFILASTAPALLQLFERKVPRIVARMSAALQRDAYRAQGGPALAAEYASLNDVDFSRHLLDGAESSLRVQSVPACGWSDLGTPRRVAATLRRRARQAKPGTEAGGRLAGTPCLAALHARQSTLQTSQLTPGAP
ncbi:MAG: NTP transferase domain-containing protein [Steroidobacteraceae bacterium]|nr:NTP transferase domain-containing protein [Steroidobacteraceae bacterium]